MIVNRVIKASLIVLSVLYVYLQIMALDYYANLTKVALFVGLTSLVMVEKTCNCLFFKLFLISFTTAEILGFSTWFLTIDYLEGIDYIYYIANGLYITSYILLLAQILIGLNLKEIVSRYYIVIFILLILDIFCVSIVTATTKGILNLPEYTMEYLYNGVIMILLSVAMINFMFRDDKKSINLLIASIFIVFTETLQLAYYYIADYSELNIMASVMLVLAFVFLYLQARLKNEEPIDYLRESLEV